jgi:hypothetical protein
VSLEILLIIIGSLGSIYYFVLGLKASSFQLATRRSEKIDKILFAAMPWSLDSKALKGEAKDLCSYGNKVMIFCSFVWIFYGFVKYSA